jgi:hypothetical protein
MLKDIVAAKALGDYRLHLRFEDGVLPPFAARQSGCLYLLAAHHTAGCEPPPII